MSRVEAREARHKRSEVYYANFRVNRDLLELRNLVSVPSSIVRSALQRHESRGSAAATIWTRCRHSDRAGRYAQPQASGAVARTAATKARLRTAQACVSQKVAEQSRILPEKLD